MNNSPTPRFYLCFFLHKGIKKECFLFPLVEVFPNFGAAWLLTRLGSSLHSTEPEGCSETARLSVTYIPWHQPGTSLAVVPSEVLRWPDVSGGLWWTGDLASASSLLYFPFLSDMNHPWGDPEERTSGTGVTLYSQTANRHTEHSPPLCTTICAGPRCLSYARAWESSGNVAKTWARRRWQHQTTTSKKYRGVTPKNKSLCSDKRNGGGECRRKT